ncbi:MAG: energy transducer TonB [Planctomycetota bacterium]
MALFVHGAAIAAAVLFSGPTGPVAAGGHVTVHLDVADARLEEREAVPPPWPDDVTPPDVEAELPLPPLELLPEPPLPPDEAPADLPEPPTRDLFVRVPVLSEAAARLRTRPEPPPPPVALPRRPPPVIVSRPPPRPAITPAPRPVRPPSSAARGPGPRLRVLYAPRVDDYYPADARRRGIQGTAVVEIVVDAAGVVTRARVVSSSGSASLDAAAVRLMHAYRFSSGSSPSRIRVPVTFRLQ